MFEFYYQTGEFRADDGGMLSDLFVQIAGTLIGGVLALLLYWYQTKNQKEGERSLKITSDNEKLLYLYSLISGAIEFTECFIAVLQQAAIQTKNNPSVVTEFLTSPWNDLARICQNINQEEHFHAHYKRVGNFKIRNVFKDIDYIDLARVQIESKLAKHITREAELRVRLSVVLSKVVDEIKRMLFDDETPGIDKTPLDVIQENYKAIRKIDVVNVQELQSEFLNPLLSHMNSRNSYRFRLLHDLTNESDQICNLIIDGNFTIGTEMEKVAIQADRCLADINLNFESLVKYLEPIRFSDR